MAPGRVSNLLGTILVVCARNAGLAERRSGYVIILLGSLLVVVPVIRMIGKVRRRRNIAKSSGAFSLVDAGSRLGVTALFSSSLGA